VESRDLEAAILTNSCVNSLTHSITEIAKAPFAMMANNVPPGPAISSAWPVGENIPPITALTTMNWLLLMTEKYEVQTGHGFGESDIKLQLTKICHHNKS
jgi:hypothetical protein